MEDNVLLAHQCPSCKSKNIKLYRRYETKTYDKRCILECIDCSEHFSETKNTFLENLRTPISFIKQVIDARAEGMGFNATARVFGISINTLKDWEIKFSKLKTPLLIYSLSEQFISQDIEGDELYTKVHENKPAHDSEGWTVVLMERASRFIWEMKCGEKDEELFLYVIEQLAEIMKKTEYLTLFTDGERRYSNFLFDLCCEAVKTGKRGRPKKTLPKDVKIRLKNKGSSSAKENRQKYEAPKPEHPDTNQNIDNQDIHANHVEAFNSSLRRKNSAYRRKTNTYAKNTTALQRTLDAQWVIHNFIKKHFTTKLIPAVAIGIIAQGLTWFDLFRMQIV